MNEASKRTLELARHLSKSYGRNDGHASAMAEKSAHNIIGDPQAHIDALVAAGVLVVDAGRFIASVDGQGGGQYYYLPEAIPTITLGEPRKVRAGYRKLDDGRWTVTCSIHGTWDFIGHQDPLLARSRTTHFGGDHPAVEWDDPPHEHQWVWNMDCVDCTCGLSFDPTRGYLHGTPYTGPVPSHLHDTP